MVTMIRASSGPAPDSVPRCIHSTGGGVQVGHERRGAVGRARGIVVNGYTLNCQAGAGIRVHRSVAGGDLARSVKDW